MTELTNSSKMERLEQQTMDDQNQIRCLRDHILAQEAQFRRLISEKETNFAVRIEQLTRTAEIAQRERDTAVVRYAQRERDILILEAANQKASKEIKNLQSDRDVLRSQIVSVKNERNSLMKTCDKNDAHLAWYKKELDRLNAVIAEAERRSNDSSSNMELQNAVEVESKMTKNTTEAISTENCPQSVEDKSSLSVSAELDFRERLSIADNRILELKSVIESKNATEVSLQSAIADLRQTLAKAEESLAEMNLLSSLMAEAQSDKVQAEVEASRCREETERLLRLVEKLTDNNVQLKTENLSLSSKLAAMHGRDSSLNEMTGRLQNSLKQSEDNLRQIQDESRSEIERLQIQLHQVCQSERDLTARLRDEQNAIKILKKKHYASIKELRNEISILGKRLEQHETGNTSQGSEISDPDVGCCQVASSLPESSENAQHDGREAVTTICLHNQMMIEKIVKLQRALARRNEKIEFFQESIKHLSSECRKKTRIIQAYVVREETGALVSNSSDLNRLCDLLDQADIAKPGNVIVSNLFGIGLSSKEMSLELAVEMVRKFQGVLEDVLIKNIMLKESVQTLGQEISRLSRENRELQLRHIVGP